MTLKGQGRDPKHLRLKYLDNSTVQTAFLRTYSCVYFQKSTPQLVRACTGILLKLQMPQLLNEQMCLESISKNSN